jgi:hypothetical protein
MLPMRFKFGKKLIFGFFVNVKIYGTLDIWVLTRLVENPADILYPA